MSTQMSRYISLHPWVGMCLSVEDFFLSESKEDYCLKIDVTECTICWPWSIGLATEDRWFTSPVTAIWLQVSPWFMQYWSRRNAIPFLEALLIRWNHRSMLYEFMPHYTSSIEGCQTDSKHGNISQKIHLNTVRTHSQSKDTTRPLYTQILMLGKLWQFFRMTKY